MTKEVKKKTIVVHLDGEGKKLWNALERSLPECGNNKGRLLYLLKHWKGNKNE